MNGYQEQIEQAKKQLATWPEWMKINGYFAGSNPSEHNRRNIMPRKIGYFNVTSAFMVELLSGVVKMPEDTDILKVVEVKNDVFSIYVTHPSFPAVDEGTLTPEYRLICVKCLDGVIRTHFELMEQPLPRKKLQLGNRFDLEQELLSLWTLFDYIHTIIVVMDTEGSTDDEMANIAFGLVDMMRVHLRKVPEYHGAKYLPANLLSRLGKHIDELYDIVSYQYDGADAVREATVQSLLRLEKRASKTAEELFEAFEQSIKEIDAEGRSL